MSLRVTLKDTVKRFPASGCAGTVYGLPITGLPGAGAVPAGVAAVTVIATTLATRTSAENGRPTARHLGFLSGDMTPTSFVEEAHA